jgi:meiotic recombination protein SPO11
VALRNIFYSAGDLFPSYGILEQTINEICCMLRCTRDILNISGRGEGRVAGDLTFTYFGNSFDCTYNFRNIDEDLIKNISDIRSEALFILLLEKECTLKELRQTHFYARFPCILITGPGQPDVPTRLLLRKLSVDLKLPVVGLVDCDPHGIQIMSVYSNGSKSMAFDGYRLTTPAYQLIYAILILC